MWKRTIIALQIVTGSLFIGALLVINFTSYSGYSYRHCDTFNWRNYLPTAEAHELLRASSPDDIRISDLHEVQHELERYFDIHKSYPVMTGYDHVQNWESLASVLSESDHGHLPADPCSKRNADYQYVYISNEARDEYVLGALLSDTDYRYVSTQYDDVDGSILGLWCGEGKFDREFCITSSH